MAKLDSLTLRGRFVANLPAGATPVYNNAPAKDITGPFIRFAVPFANSTADNVGPNPRERTSGMVTMSIFVPRETGDAIALALADQCAAIFRNWRWFSGSDSLTAGQPQIVEIDTDPDWYQVRVSVPWESLHQY